MIDVSADAGVDYSCRCDGCGRCARIKRRPSLPRKASHASEAVNEFKSLLTRKRRDFDGLQRLASHLSFAHCPQSTLTSRSVALHCPEREAAPDSSARKRRGYPMVTG